jgi:hypothetical protein
MAKDSEMMPLAARMLAIFEAQSRQILRVWRMLL